MSWGDDPEITQALSGLRTLIDKNLGWSSFETDYVTIRRILDTDSGLIVYAYKWGNSNTTAISRVLFANVAPHDLYRSGDFLQFGPWWCRVVDEDERTVTVERQPEP